VQDYTKPPYSIDVNADKKAAFAGDTVAFTVKAGFFEGTPVSGLDVSYRLWGYQLSTKGNGGDITDLDGKIVVSETIRPTAEAMGQTNLTFAAEATLPEIGDTYKDASVRVFVNDMEINAQAKRTGNNVAMKAGVNSISLDKINDGTAEHYNDYLDKPVANKTLNVEVYRVYYKKVKYDEYYDFIEKKTLPRYRYEHNEEIIDKFNFTTGGDGTVEKTLNVPGREFESYYAKLAGVDGNGRKNDAERIFRHWL
jgi:uncharacterized protein YfaS (alpha-2-macroglobulin family)